MSNRSRHVLLLLWLTVAVTGGALVIWYVLWGGLEGDRPNRAQVAGTVWAVVILLPPLLRWIWLQWRLPEADPSALALAQLRNDLKRRWARDPVWQSVRAGERLRIRWRPAEAELFPANESAWTDLPSSDDGARLARLFTANDAPRRLVVLGDPGLGKTELLVAACRAMLFDTRPDRPVPVLVPLSSWHSNRDDPGRWLIDRMHADYSFLRRRMPEGGTLAESLADAGQLTFVLDGLDEIDPKFRLRALEELNRIDDRWLIMISSRPGEYPRFVLSGARGIELGEQEPAAALSYLAERSRPPERWTDIERKLLGDRAVTEVLKNPLMIMLADAIYNGDPALPAREPLEPAALLDEDPSPLEHRLLSGFLAARYPPNEAAAASEQTWSLETAQRGLGYLADMLGKGRELQWWDLPIPPTARRNPKMVAAITAIALVAWTALSAGLVNQWLFDGAAVGVTDAVRTSSAGLLVYLSLLYLTGDYGDAVLAAVGAYIAGVPSGSYDLAVAVGLVVGFSWHLAHGPGAGSPRRGQLRHAIPLGVAATLAAAAIRGLGFLIPMNDTLTVGYGGGAIDGSAIRWDDDANGWIATTIMTTLIVWAGILVTREAAEQRPFSTQVHPMLYAIIIGLLVASFCAWADTTGRVRHGWMIAPSDGLAAGLAVWWVLNWPWAWSRAGAAGVRVPPLCAGLLVAGLGAGFNMVGYSNRMGVESGWARGLAEGLSDGTIVWLALDLRRRTAAVGARNHPSPAQRHLSLARVAATSLAVGALHIISADVAEGLANAVGFGLVAHFLSRSPTHRGRETKQTGVEAVEVGVFMLTLVGLLAGFGYGLMFGVVAGLGCRVAQDVALRRQPSGWPGFSRAGAAAGAMVGGVTLLGSVFDRASAVGLVLIGVTSATAGALAFGIQPTNLDRVREATPYSLYKSDRAAALSIVGIVAVTLGLAVGFRAAETSGSIRTGVIAGSGTLVTYGFSAGVLVSIFMTRFLVFNVARVRLYYCEYLPWALMSFLDDGHRKRLVLRSIGPAYQFRHEHLEDEVAKFSPLRAQPIKAGSQQPPSLPL